MKNKTITKLNASLTAEQRSENARNAALIGVQKRKEKIPKKLDDEIVDLEIFYDIPCPKSIFGNRQRKFPFLEKMELGGHIMVKDKGLFDRIYSCAAFYGKSSEKTFAARKTRDGFGLWRVK